MSTAFGEIKALVERKGRPIEDFDAAIAAHAVANAATLVSAAHTAGHTALSPNGPHAHGTSGRREIQASDACNRSVSD